MCPEYDDEREENGYSMMVIVGSKNKVKINAVCTSLRQLYSDATVQAIGVCSGVSDQPWGDKEIIKGAITRAQSALEIVGDADLGVGIEAGIIRNELGFFTNAWCAICDQDGQISLGGGFNVELPHRVIQSLNTGKDLGEAMSQIPTPYDHQQVGAIGVLTDTILDRQKAYESIVLCAMARYIRSDLYLDDKSQ